MCRKVMAVAFSVIVALGIGGGAVFAQHGGHGGDTQGAMQESTQGSMTATAQMMRNVDTMMRNIDSMMTNASSAMRDLNAMHARMPGGLQLDPMMTSMQGTFDQMRQIRGSLNDMMRNPAVGSNAQSMRAFQQACRNLEQMTSAFQSMTKNMAQGMKGMTSEPKK